MRSGLEFAALADVADVLDGRSGGAAGADPKKSSPSSESAGFVAFGGAGVGLDIGGPVLDRAGAETGSSPKRSTTGACRVIADGPERPGGGATCLWEADLSITTFCWTTFRGWHGQHSGQNPTGQNRDSPHRRRLPLLA